MRRIEHKQMEIRSAEKIAHLQNSLILLMIVFALTTGIDMLIRNLILLIALFCSLNVSDVASGQLAQNQIDQPNDGESRPVWWHQLWQGNLIVLLGKLQHDPSKSDSNIEYVVTEGGKKELKRLSIVSLSIEDEIDIPRWVKITSSGAFKKGMVVDIYLPEQFNADTQKWMRPPFENGEKIIVFLDDVSILKSGSYYIKGFLNPKLLRNVREVIELRNKPK